MQLLPDSNTNLSSTASDAASATAPRFVRAVYDMLQNEDQRILSWSADGSHFQVYDVARLESEVLRKYFKHNKFSSFQRQLNNFGFHKWTKTRASVATFSHDVLVRCHPAHLGALASQMTPMTPMKTQTKTTPAAFSSVPVEPCTAAKRPRALLAVPSEQPASVKKHKMSPRDVCAVDDQADISFSCTLEPLWLLDGNYSKGDLLLDWDAVDLVELDWDAVISPVEIEVEAGCDDNDFGSVMGVDADLACAAVCGLLTDDDVAAALDNLDAADALLGRDLDAMLGVAISDMDFVDDFIDDFSVDADAMLSV
jgi:hypothetical protein